jgi:ion channel-forming bestrophin family protein
MIVKHNLSPSKVLTYVWKPLAYAGVFSVVVVALRRATGSEAFSVPFAPVGTLGAALAIFVAFRNNASYGRWWEARTVWGNLHNSSRVLARQIVAATDSAIASKSGGTEEAVLAFRREIVLRIAAVSHSLRTQLRETPEWASGSLPGLLPASEFQTFSSSQNPTNLMIQRIGIRIKDGVREGMIGQFDPISLEPNLAGMNAAVTACERIKSTPTPRQYDYFTRLALGVFSTLLPFGLESLIPAAQEWWVVLMSLVVSGVFIILERVGAVIDAPFENKSTDIPMTYLSTAIERDLREQIGDSNLPSAIQVVDGYLW